jgi:hypothetical protein
MIHQSTYSTAKHHGYAKENFTRVCPAPLGERMERSLGEKSVSTSCSLSQERKHGRRKDEFVSI